MTSQDGANKYKPRGDMPFEEAIIRHFKRLDPKIKSTEVKDAIFEVNKEEVMRAFNETERKGKESALEYFKKILRKNPPRKSFEESHSPCVIDTSVDDWLKE
jgi:hypothetical protein